MIDNIYSQVDWNCPINYNTHMKVIKLNRRYKLFKQHGYEAGLKFDGWGNQARLIENSCREHLGFSLHSRDAEWYEYFGKSPDGIKPLPYFIMFQKESTLSIILLCADLSKKG